jgi:hypothetical protein
MKSGSVEADGKETPLGKAIQAASLLADSKGDYVGAVKVLDKVLGKYPEPSNEWVQAMVARAELALTMGDEDLARKLVADIRRIGLMGAEELRRIVDIEQAIE